MSARKPKTTRVSVRLSPDEVDVLRTICDDMPRALHTAIALLGFRPRYEAPKREDALTDPLSAARKLIDELKQQQGETK